VLSPARGRRHGAARALSVSRCPGHHGGSAVGADTQRRTGTMGQLQSMHMRAGAAAAGDTSRRPNMHDSGRIHGSELTWARGSARPARFGDFPPPDRWASARGAVANRWVTQALGPT
jgi:hypothetical protein